MPSSKSDLIYDVGLCDGEDTAYYLFRGYRVVAIDANPLMIENARLRFAAEIKDDRLTLLNFGIAETQGTATFWVSDREYWSSFDRTIASRDGTGHRPVQVSTMPFGQIIAEYGVPHYLKIDIEGHDRVCVASLNGSTLPNYLSVESECVGDSGPFSDEEATSMLQLLRDLGYRRFKLVRQGSVFNSVRQDAGARLLARLANGASYGRLKWLSPIAARFTDSARIAKLGFEFSAGSSGPWGDDIPGDWMPFEKARALYLRERHAYFAKNKNESIYSFWYDWHAAH